MLNSFVPRQKGGPELTDVRLDAVLYCPFGLKSETLSLPESVPASRGLDLDELSLEFRSPYLRSGDVPIPFLREPPLGFAPPVAFRNNIDLAEKLSAYGQTLQYRFSDGLILTGCQILYHPYVKHVARHFLPLNVNITSEVREKTRFTRAMGWENETEQVIMSVLLATARAIRLSKQSEEIEAPALYICEPGPTTKPRRALRIDSVELQSSNWGPWRLTTELPEPVSHVHYGRARLELDPNQIGGFEGLFPDFLLNIPERQIVFHAYGEEIRRFKSHLGTNATESGLTLHLAGHAHIQASIEVINELRGPTEPSLPIHPVSRTVEREAQQPRLMLTGDGSFRFFVGFKDSVGEWEAHGFSQSLSYLLHGLQFGLGATTGFANTQIAQSRRGPRRERDLKVLRHIGYAALVIYEAASFGLGLPLLDGTTARDESEVTQSLLNRIGSLVLKSEIWPGIDSRPQDLCSNNVITLIGGLVKQIAMDARGRDLHIYLPHGELKLRGGTRPVIQLFHAMLADLIEATRGQCFTKARLKAFENLMNGRTASEQDDLVVRPAVDPDAPKQIYHPGINERYHLPEPLTPVRSAHVLGLIEKGFSIAIDGKEVEAFEASDFKPQFTLRETPTDTVLTGGYKINWFELHPKFFFKGIEISGDQAARLSRDGLIEFEGKLYRISPKDLPNLKRLTRFWAGIQSHNAGLMKEGKRRKTEETYYQLPRSQTLELLALRASGVKIRGGERWDEICRFYDSLDQPRPPLEMPPSFKAKLQPYQLVGVQWILDLRKLGLGGILADDMGLGKTVTSLAFLELERIQNRMGPCLIVVPTSLTYNWVAEAARFTPELPIQIFSGRDPERMLDAIRTNDHVAIVCTYGLLQEHIETLQQVKWNCLILDEAQNLKNITTKRTTAARKLEAAFKLCLTGTPLENHYGELYSLIDLTVPGSLGDIASFRERYVNPVRVLREDIDDLRLKTKPLILRRTKAQVMHQLPPKIETTVKLPFEEEQRKIYRDIAASYNEQVRLAIASQGEAKSQLQMLTALLRLRQVCSDPASVPGVKYNGEPPKLATLLEALEEITDAGESALVFTQFLATFQRIRRALAERKIRHYDISGADSRVSREKKIRAFQEDNAGSVMLMTLKTGGVGLNLVKASYIFHIEPWWNPAVENQATDRAHRIGQTKTVQVYRYLIKDSVEEKIELLKEIKAKRFEALFDVAEGEFDLGSGSSALTQQDFEFLLS